MSAAAENADTPDLEALFDSIASARPGNGAAVDMAAANEPAANESTAAHASDEVINKLGQMTRKLHDSLRELGYDKVLEKAASSMPDARDRLTYVAAMTEQAAGKVLNATEAARPIQDGLCAGAGKLAADWDRMMDQKLSVEEFKALVGATRKYLAEVPQQTAATNAHLHEIMMAQDFQDLTGQVIKKITEVARDMEEKLVNVLLDVTPREKLAEVESGLLNGPVINGHLRTDVVTSQNQVDELLESLGF